MNRWRWVVLSAGIILAATSVWQLFVIRNGLEIIQTGAGELPVTLIKQAGQNREARPLVLIGHGLAGSRVIMHGFGLELAKAGFDVALWDFAGHGANPQPMASNEGRSTLVEDAGTARRTAVDAGLGASGQVAILGHSMGSGAALSYGQEYPQTAATIAVSPVGIPVTPELPRNLLLMAGRNETRFVENAGALIIQAGGEGGDPAMGTARRLVIIPGVEHISILFSPMAHEEARKWLEEVFGVQPGAAAYVDLRVLWYALGLCGSLLMFWAAAPLVRSAGGERRINLERSLAHRIGALLGGALGATLLLWGVERAGLELRALMGVLVGGYLLLWFAAAGVLSLVLMGMRPQAGGWGFVREGLFIFASLWLGVGLLGQLVWLEWLLIPTRLVLWPFGVLLVLPWSLAVGLCVEGASAAGKAGWWLVHSLIVLGALFLALQLSPSLGFLILILPLFPVILGLQALMSAPFGRAWSHALGAALFLSWTMLAVFPLA